MEEKNHNSMKLRKMTFFPPFIFLLLIVAAVIAVIFIATAVSGLKKGIKLCADINVYGYVVFLLFLLFFGATAFVFNLGTEAFGGSYSHRRSVSVMIKRLPPPG